MSSLSIGICGGGIGGLSAAIALRSVGHRVDLFERSNAYDRVGADINLTPNAVFALDKLGVGKFLRQHAARPTYRISRDGITGEVLSRLPMSKAAEEKYGAPQLTIHRADLLDALQTEIPQAHVNLNCGVSTVLQDGNKATMVFENGTKRSFDLVVGADGIHSVVRAALWGEDKATFTGLVSYRGVFESDKVAHLPNREAFTKWWGETTEKQIVTFPLTQGREIFVFATTAQNGWTEEGWTLPGNIEDLRSIYRNFHPEARALLDACEKVTRSALHVREPMAQWARGRITICGDAAHPMVPFMAQGACMTIEDAVVLARALEGKSNSEVEIGLASYESARKPRTAKVQKNSLANEWLKNGSNADWVYSYDAWSAELN